MRRGLGAKLRPVLFGLKEGARMAAKGSFFFLLLA